MLLETLTMYTSSGEPSLSNVAGREKDEQYNNNDAYTLIVHNETDIDYIMLIDYSYIYIYLYIYHLIKIK